MWSQANISSDTVSCKNREPHIQHGYDVVQYRSRYFNRYGVIRKCLFDCTWFNLLKVDYIGVGSSREHAVLVEFTKLDNSVAFCCRQISVPQQRSTWWGPFHVVPLEHVNEGSISQRTQSLEYRASRNVTPVSWYFAISIIWKNLVLKPKDNCGNAKMIAQKLILRQGRPIVVFIFTEVFSFVLYDFLFHYAKPYDMSSNEARQNLMDGVFSTFTFIYRGVDYHCVVRLVCPVLTN